MGWGRRKVNERLRKRDREYPLPRGFSDETDFYLLPRRQRKRAHSVGCIMRQQLHDECTNNLCPCWCHEVARQALSEGAP